MHAHARVARRAPIHLHVRLLADRRDNNLEPMRPRRVEQQKWKPAIAGNQTELRQRWRAQV